VGAGQLSLLPSCGHPGALQVVGLDFAAEMLDDAAARQARLPNTPRYRTPIRCAPAQRRNASAINPSTTGPAGPVQLAAALEHPRQQGPRPGARSQLQARRPPRRPAALPSRWVQGDAMDLPFGPAEFDAATMGYGLRNVADINKALSELHRVLKPGATAAVLDFNNSTDPLVDASQVGLRRLARLAGLAALLPSCQAAKLQAAALASSAWPHPPPQQPSGGAQRLLASAEPRPHPCRPGCWTTWWCLPPPLMGWRTSTSTCGRPSRGFPLVGGWQQLVVVVRAGSGSGGGG
jgi:SAM-dependent methyltransferase